MVTGQGDDVGWAVGSFFTGEVSRWEQLLMGSWTRRRLSVSVLMHLNPACQRWLALAFLSYDHLK